MQSERIERAGDSGPGWQLTLWTMVAVQFVMSISFSIVSPIMPLFLPVASSLPRPGSTGYSP